MCSPYILLFGGGLVAAIASGRPGRASAGLTWSSPQSAASLAFLALAAGPAARSGTGGAGRPRCRFVAGEHGGATLCPGAQRMWGAARARGGASSPGTREHGRGPQERSIGGWRALSFDGVSARGWLWVGRRGRSRRGGVWAFLVSVSEGVGAEAAGVLIVERIAARQTGLKLIEPLYASAPREESTSAHEPGHCFSVYSGSAI
jgi:hypothetical protein